MAFCRERGKKEKNIMGGSVFLSSVPCTWGDEKKKKRKKGKSNKDKKGEKRHGTGLFLFTRPSTCSRKKKRKERKYRYPAECYSRGKGTLKFLPHCFLILCRVPLRGGKRRKKKKKKKGREAGRQEWNLNQRGDISERPLCLLSALPEGSVRKGERKKRERGELRIWRRRERGFCGSL